LGYRILDTGYKLGPISPLVRDGSQNLCLIKGSWMKITIIGASGCVGSCAAFYLAAGELADEILMIGGRKQNVLKQHAMDLGTAVSARDVIVRAGDFEDMPGSDIVINAAGAPQGVINSRMEMLPKNIPIIRDISLHIRKYCPEAIVITASNPVDPLNYATYLCSHLDRSKFIGYSINDSFRFREMVARAVGARVGEVEGTVIGEHGSTQVLLFSTVKVNGAPIFLSQEIKEGIRAEVPNILKRYEELQSGRTAGWTCAVGLADIVRAISNDSRETFPCSVVLDGEYGYRGLSMSVPAVIGGNGIERVLEWELAPDEQEGLKITADTLKAAASVVEKSLTQG